MERAKEERSGLIWKIRSSAQDNNQKNIIHSALRNIVSDELKRIKNFSSSEGEFSTSNDDDPLWEYDAMHVDFQDEFDNEDIMIEMENALYEELKRELVKRALDGFEEEEEYLAQAVYEKLQLDENQNNQINRVWCPVCKQGELTQSHHLICCTRCTLQLDVENDKMNLNILQDRLGQVHENHLNQGCRSTPKFCMESRFNITALYIQCQVCNTFEVVL